LFGQPVACASHSPGVHIFVYGSQTSVVVSPHCVASVHATPPLPVLELELELEVVVADEELDEELELDELEVALDEELERVELEEVLEALVVVEPVPVV